MRQFAPRGQLLECDFIAFADSAPFLLYKVRKPVSHDLRPTDSTAGLPVQQLSANQQYGSAANPYQMVEKRRTDKSLSV